jgi:hypothetical protein
MSGPTADSGIVTATSGMLDNGKRKNSHHFFHHPLYHFISLNFMLEMLGVSFLHHDLFTQHLHGNRLFACWVHLLSP